MTTTFIVNQAGFYLYGGVDGVLKRMRERNATECKVSICDLNLGVFAEPLPHVTIRITNADGCYIANNTLYNKDKVKGDVVVAIVNSIPWITHLDLNVVLHYTTNTVPMRSGLISTSVKRDFSGDLSSWMRKSSDTLRHVHTPGNSMFDPVLPHVRSIVFEKGFCGRRWDTPQLRKATFGGKSLRMHTYYPGSGKVHESKNIAVACTCYANCAKDQAVITLALVMRAYGFPRDIRLLVLHDYVKHVSSDAWAPSEVIWNLDGTICYSSSDCYDFKEQKKRWDEVKAAKRIYQSATKKKNQVEGKLKRKQREYEEAELEESKAHVAFLEKMKSMKK